MDKLTARKTRGWVWWGVASLLFGSILACGFGVQLLPTPETVQETVIVTQMLPSDITLTALANESTAASALTATALAKRDDDGDGLSNNQEENLGTNPYQPDTDEDGLPDGLEVELGTDPLNPDTDGDGLPDNVDSDPGQLPSPTISGSTPAPESTITVSPEVVTEERIVEVDWPARMRVGDKETLRLSLRVVDEEYIIPTAEIDGHEVFGEPIAVETLPATHDTFIIAQLEADGFEIDGWEEPMQRFIPAYDHIWRWRLKTEHSGKHQVKIGLRLRFVPRESGDLIERPLWGQELPVEARKILGLPGPLARLAGLLGSILGSGVEFAVIVGGRRRRKSLTDELLEAEPVHFTTYHPKELAPSVWNRMITYAHITSAIEAIQADSLTALGPGAKEYGTGRGRATHAIARGAEIMVVPELPGCQFNPPRASFLWLENWHRVDFRVQALATLPGYEPGTAVNGQVAFYVGPILVAETKIWAFLTEETEAIPVDRPKISSTADPYDAVFVSYSHQDTEIIEELEKAYTALGMKYLRDVHSLRSGEHWNPRLLDMIREADIFQLCWSHMAKNSSFVEQEWRHALEVDQPAFIRPIYWEKPIPEPPPELSHIHFAYYALEDH